VGSLYLWQTTFSGPVKGKQFLFTVRGEKAPLRGERPFRKEKMAFFTDSSKTFWKINEPGKGEHRNLLLRVQAITFTIVGKLP